MTVLAAASKLLPAPAHRRRKYFVSHLLISAAAVGLLAAVVFFAWYPGPFFIVQGAAVILMLVVLVDVVLGPGLTLILATPSKAQRLLVLDLIVIGTVQMAALVYGAHILFVARPAFVVFNADRFDVVAALDVVRGVQDEYFDPSFASTPVDGPVWALAKPPEDLEERNAILFAAVQGGPDIKNFPRLYHRWPPSEGTVRSKLKPIADLAKVSPDAERMVQDVLQIPGLSTENVSFVHLVGYERTGVVILNKDTLEVIRASSVTPGS